MIGDIINSIEIFKEAVTIELACTDRSIS